MGQKIFAIEEVRRYVALPCHPHVLKLLDIGLSAPRLHQPPAVGLVFERYDTDLRKFLQKTPLRMAGMRHVLRSLLGALNHMHGLGVVHADLKPANILLRGAGAFKDNWRRLFGPEWLEVPDNGSALVPRAASSSRGVDRTGQALEIVYQFPASFEAGSFF